MELKVKQAIKADCLDIGSSDDRDEIAIVLSYRKLDLAFVMFLDDRTSVDIIKAINEGVNTIRLRRARRLAEAGRKQQGQS
jgi:hypothetical protein